MLEQRIGEISEWWSGRLRHNMKREQQIYKSFEKSTHRNIHPDRQREIQKRRNESGYLNVSAAVLSLDGIII